MSARKRRFTLIDGYQSLEVNPLSFLKNGYAWTRSQDRIFFRKELKNNLVFTNHNGSSDYSYFNSIEASHYQRCSDLYILIEVLCDGGWEQEWRGVFTTGQGSFDKDRCVFEVKPEPDDRYRCLLTDLDNEVNILDTPEVVTVNALITPTFEYHVYRNDDLTLSQGVLISLAHASLPDLPTSWMLLGVDKNHFDFVVVFFRESVTLACIDGSPSPPDGGSWQLLSNDCGINDTATYVRQPVGYSPSFGNDNITAGDCSGSSGTTEEIPPARKYIDVYIDDLTRHNMKIRGFPQVGPESRNIPYRVLNYPTGATFSWSIYSSSLTTPSIVGGGATDTVLIDNDTVSVPVTGVQNGEYTLECQVTDTCGNTANVYFDVVVQSQGELTPLWDTDELYIYGLSTVCSESTGLVYSVPEEYVFDPESIISMYWYAYWQPSSTQAQQALPIASGQGTHEITIDFTGADKGIVELACHVKIYDSSNPLSGTGYVSSVFTKTIKITPVVRTDDIQGPSSMCDNETAVYSIPARPGATYDWAVEGCSLDGGQGTNEITVIFDLGQPLATISVKETVPCGCDWILITECTEEGYPPYYWCNTQAIKEYDNGRWLMGAIEYMLSQSGCSVTRVVSDFFLWNPIGDAPGYDTSCVPECNNYVTGTPHQHRYLTIHQKSDVIDPEASGVATKGLWTLKKSLDTLRESMNVYWHITDNNELRLEHISYYAAQAGLDLTAAEFQEQLKGLNRYSHNKDELPKFERYKWMEALNTDFVGAEIRYETLCVNQIDGENRVEHSVPDITTDISYINTDPSEISKDGFVIMASYRSGSDYNLITDAGALSGGDIVNAPMSWANLHRDFHRHHRYQRVGYMNNTFTQFLSIRNTIKQTPLEVKPTLCCDINSFDPAGYLTTPLGNDHLGGITGTADKAEHSIENESLKLTIGYPY
jgi:hypothetical protein